MAASALDFVPMGTNAETLPANLTERRFRHFWEQTDKSRGAVLAVARSTPATVASRTKSLTISFTSLDRTPAYSSRSVKSPHLVLQNPQPVLARNRLRSDRPSARRNTGRPVRGKPQRSRTALSGEVIRDDMLANSSRGNSPAYRSPIKRLTRYDLSSAAKSSTTASGENGGRKLCQWHRSRGRARDARWCPGPPRWCDALGWSVQLHLPATMGEGEQDFGG